MQHYKRIALTSKLYSVVEVTLIEPQQLVAVKQPEQCVNSFSIQIFLSYRDCQHCPLVPAFNGNSNGNCAEHYVAERFIPVSVVEL